MSDHISRRRFLHGTAGTLVLAAFPAAADGSPAAPRTLADLRRRVRGTVVTPADPGWSAALELHNPRLQTSPRVIVFCERSADVGAVLAFARARRWPASARSGRHSFAGYGNAAGGIVADVSRMREVHYDPHSGLVRLGGGVQVLDVYRDLVVRHDVALPVGTCPTVGIAGLTVGGGFGRLMRRHGVSADSLRAATVVLAGGRVVRCDAEREPDLFWAVRGGGAGFGVITSMTFATRAPADPIAFTLSFEWERAAAAIDAWQSTLPQASAQLAYGRFRALKLANGTLSAAASGHWHGAEAELRAVLGPLLAAGPRSASIRAVPFLDASLPDGTTRAPDGSVSAKVDRYPNYQRSDFFSSPLPPEAIGALLARIEAWPGGGPDAHEGGVQLDALGGAVNAVAPTATAFVHRRQQFHCAYLSFWGASDPPSVAAANTQWTRDASATLRPWRSGAAFQNYIDPELADSDRAYYGENLPRLRRIARRYDPERRFAFAQDVRSP